MKKIISYLVAVFLLFSFAGQAVCAAEVSNIKPVSTNRGLSSGGSNDSHQLFAKQSFKILEKEKGSSAVSGYSEYKDVLFEYCDMPDKDEKDYIFAYHFYDPYTKKNYLPGVMKSSKITALTKFKEHIKNSVENYKSNKKFSIEELGRAIHFLEDVNVPHHASNQIAGLSSHSQYEKYISENNSLFYVYKSNSYDKFSNLSFEDFCVSIFDECAKNAYSYKSVGKSYDKEEWKRVATATLKLAQENISALLYRFSQEVK